MKNEISLEKERVFRDYYKLQKRHLNNRARNVLSSSVMKGEDLLPLKTYFDKPLDFFLEFDNSGKKTAYDLHLFFTKLKEKYNEITEGKEISSNDFFNYKIKTLTRGKVNIEDNQIEQNPFIWFYDIMKSNINQRCAEMLLMRSNGYSLKKIAEKEGLTRERVRQLFLYEDKYISNTVSLIKSEFDINFKFIELFKNDFSNIEDEEFIEVLKNSKLAPLTNSKRYLDKIVSAILESEGFILIPSKIKLLNPPRCGVYKYNQYQEDRIIRDYWILKKDLITRKTLKSKASKILKITCSKNTCDTFISWDKLDMHSQRQIDFFQQFLMKELGVDADDQGIFITRNTPMTYEELVYIALEELDIMSTLDDILQKMKYLFPQKADKFKTDSIRSTIVRHKQLFIYERMQTSLYGLKIWEEQKGLKGGTIKDMVADFLIEQERPCHIHKIAQHIMKYRSNTNANSIRWNLSQDTTGKFVFYKGGKIGLRNMKKEITSNNNPDLDAFIDKLFDY